MPRFAKMISSVCFCLAACLIAAQPARAQSADTTFFVTSNGIGNGANLGGLAGADGHCQALAAAAGRHSDRLALRHFSLVDVDLHTVAS